MNGKGDTPRKVDSKKWDNCPLWKNLKKQKELEVERIIEDKIWEISKNVDNSKG